MEIPGTEEDNEICPSLTLTQRIIGFVCALCVGFIFAIISWVAVFNQDWTLFGIGITLSNLCAIGGSMFIAGPKKQAKKMFEETRWIATTVYLVAMVLTLVMALAVKNGPVTILFCIIQYLAMIWYGLSFIPYARTAVKKMFGC